MYNSYGNCWRSVNDEAGIVVAVKSHQRQNSSSPYQSRRFDLSWRLNWPVTPHCPDPACHWCTGDQDILFQPTRYLWRCHVLDWGEYRGDHLLCDVANRQCISFQSNESVGIAGIGGEGYCRPPVLFRSRRPSLHPVDDPGAVATKQFRQRPFEWVAFFGSLYIFKNCVGCAGYSCGRRVASSAKWPTRWRSSCRPFT
jgi:hypothetical protein